MISDELGDDHEEDEDDDDAATHVIATKDVLTSEDLAELAESDFRPARQRPPPIPSRAPLAQPSRPAGPYVKPAWQEEEGENDETLTYGESQGNAIDDDDVPTRMPPQVVPNGPATQAAPSPRREFADVSTSGFRGPSSGPGMALRPSSLAPPARGPYDGSLPHPYEPTAVSQRANMHGPASIGPDFATKLLLTLIVLLAMALAVVLVLIARR